MKPQSLLLVAASIVSSSAKVFSINEDYLAFPQYQIVFSDTYVLDTDAEASLALASSYSSARSKSTEISSSTVSVSSSVADVSTIRNRHGGTSDGTMGAGKERHEYMLLGSSPYLCTLPVVTESQNRTEVPQSKEDELKELARATDRGWELLKELESRPCLYFEAGWWSYSFCHNKQVKQFHRLPPGKAGAAATPIEDESVPSFVLGQFPGAIPNKIDTRSQQLDQTASGLVSAHTRGDMRYMVQKLAAGDICDITLKPRKVEVQFHCHPQSGDRIGLIKEVSTCAYLMIIYTPRLCDDVAFQPSKESQAQQIVCKEILKESEVDQWQAKKSSDTRGKLDAQTEANKENGKKPAARQVVGGIELGGMKEVGAKGRRIDPPKVFVPQEQAGEIVAKWHPLESDGKVQQLSEQQLQDLGLSGSVVREMTDQLQEIANGSPFQVRLVEKGDGMKELRGILEDEEEDENGVPTDSIPQNYQGEDRDAGDQGSKEVYKDEL